MFSFLFAYSGGNGTATDPYLIATPADINTLGETSDDWWKFFKLVADINMGNSINTNYKIIGNANHHFTGTFDGNGHKIRNLTYATTPVTDYVGLFGYINNATIKNLGVEDINVSGGRLVGGIAGFQYGTRSSITNCYSTGSVTGNEYTGGLCGGNYCEIIGCYSNTSVIGIYYSNDTGGLCGRNNGTIINCYSMGNVSGSYDTGGLCGEIVDCNIYNSYSTANVTGRFNPTGGLCGSNCRSNIAKCYSKGKVSGGSGNTGGLCGWNYQGDINACYSISDIVVTGSSSSSVGGLCGLNTSGNITDSYSNGKVAGIFYDTGGFCGYNSKGNIIRCYSTGYVTGSSYPRGLCGFNAGTVNNSFWDKQTSGQSNSSGGVGLITTDMQKQATFINAGWDFENVWKICNGTNYPKLAWQPRLAGDFGCPDGTDVYDLVIFSNQWLDSGIINFLDFASFANSWQGDMNELLDFSFQWLQRKSNSADIAPAPGGDCIINFKDFALFAENWVTQN
jgi:hypothetical protein